MTSLGRGQGDNAWPPSPLPLSDLLLGCSLARPNQSYHGGDQLVPSSKAESAVGKRGDAAAQTRSRSWKRATPVELLLPSVKTFYGPTVQLREL